MLGHMKARPLLPVVLLLVLALTRTPGLMPPNFSAVYGLLFCAGVYLSGGLAWWLPLGVLALTDLALNWYYGAPLLAPQMLGTYGAYAGLILLGRRFSPHTPFLGLLSGGVLGAVLFYLLTNTLSWLFDPHYLKTLGGWIQALTVGRPEFPPTWEFFRNTLLSGGLFTGLFVGAMKWATARERPEEAETEPAEEGDPGEAEPDQAKA
jgi:hypothetical protein